MLNPAQLSHIYWLGGSPCSGKSTIANALAERFGFYNYNCDEAYYRHLERISPERQPVWSRLARLSSEDLWITRPVEQQVAEEIEVYREQFPFILADLLALPAGRPVLVEGAALLPECVASLFPDSARRIPAAPRPECAASLEARAVWVVPSPGFQQEHYRRRGWWREVVKDCSNPALAFDNWMQRDMAFARFVRAQAAGLGLPGLLVDGTQTIEQNIAFVQAQFRLE